MGIKHADLQIYIRKRALKRSQLLCMNIAVCSHIPASKVILTVLDGLEPGIINQEKLSHLHPLHR